MSRLGQLETLGKIQKQIKFYVVISYTLQTQQVFVHDQFLAGLAFVSKHTSFAQTIKAAFKACDSNGDGVLSRDEVARSLHNMFPELPDPKISHLFDTLDLDHDGSVSWEEFSNFLQRNPEYLAVIMAARPNLLKAPEEP
jgi:Ca2+-binding EF-hand superfamily protein